MPDVTITLSDEQYSDLRKEACCDDEPVAEQVLHAVVGRRRPVLHGGGSGPAGDALSVQAWRCRHRNIAMTFFRDNAHCFCRPAPEHAPYARLCCFCDEDNEHLVRYLAAGQGIPMLDDCRSHDTYPADVISPCQAAPYGEPRMTEEERWAKVREQAAELVQRFDQPVNSGLLST